VVRSTAVYANVEPVRDGEAPNSRADLERVVERVYSDAPAIVHTCATRPETQLVDGCSRP